MKRNKKTSAVWLAILLFCGGLTGCIETEPISATSAIDKTYIVSDTTATTTKTTKAVVAIQDDDMELMVWIPKSGHKYHSKSSCSGMKNPSKVTLETAKSLGFTACKKCY